MKKCPTCGIRYGMLMVDGVCKKLPCMGCPLIQEPTEHSKSEEPDYDPVDPEDVSDMFPPTENSKSNFKRLDAMKVKCDVCGHPWDFDQDECSHDDAHPTPRSLWKSPGKPGKNQVAGNPGKSEQNTIWVCANGHCYDIPPKNNQCEIILDFNSNTKCYEFLYPYIPLSSLDAVKEENRRYRAALKEAKSRLEDEAKSISDSAIEALGEALKGES